MAALKITSRANGKENAAQYSLTLSYDLRQKSRLRTQLDNGLDVGILLDHGQRLRHGDLLQAENGSVIEIRAAEEAVSTISSNDPLQRMRVCYHLGNRHVPLQIEEQWIRYMQDPVLDNMVKNLGLNVTHENAVFEPESGAYSNHNHG